MMNENISILLTVDKLNLTLCNDFVQDEECGGIAVFVGTVRNSTQNKTVKNLDFSAYEPMAEKEMKKIAEQAIKKLQVSKIAIHHALGNLQIGETAVIIAASSAHREAAFKACQYAIDTLKKTVPIWKKEYFEDGEVWVNAHP